MARFCGMVFQKATGTSFQFVPYRGGAPALQDLVAGQVDLSCDLAANSLGAVPQRQHQGLCGDDEVALVRGARRADRRRGRRAGAVCRHLARLWAPKGTPADVVARVNAAANAAMADPATQQRIADLGMDLPPADQQTPAAFAAFHKAEVEKWYPIVKAAGVKAQ